MKQLIALVASPRKPGNGELFIRAVAKELGDQWSLEIIRLAEWNINPCKACYTCLFEKCPQKDDMDELISRIVNADAVAITAPTYFLGANSLIKRFIDRGLMFYAVIDRLWNKPVVAVTTAGIEGMEGYAKLMLDSAAKIMGGRLLASVVVYGAFPGEGVMGDKNTSLVQLVSRAISENKPNAPNPDAIVCPLCGGDSFRFLGESNRIRCLTCSNTGYYGFENGKMFVSIEPGEHQLFLSLKHALDHAEWLRSMKKKFLEMRGQLKPVVQECVKTGRVVHPDRANNDKVQK
jgi:multimeric flavodoxin WrbA